MRLLVVVDMQNDFITGALGSKEAQSIVENVKAKIEEYENNRDIVVYTQDTHKEETYFSTEEGKNLPVLHCVIGSDGWKLDDRLSQHAPFGKETFGSMLLAEFIQATQFDTIEFVGLCTDICVISNAVLARSAAMNSHIIVDAACCAGVTSERHDIALEAMKALHIEVINQGREPWRKEG